MIKAVFAVLCLALVASALTDKEEWTIFKSKHQRVYGTEAEESLRFEVFSENLRTIERLNAESDGAVYAVNKFTDLTPKEFRATRLNLNPAARHAWKESLPQFRPVDAIASVDWRDATKNPLRLKAVSRVKDQEQCGSCWAFSATASLEGCKMIINGDNVDVNGSPQFLVDCCHDGNSMGCNGGDEDSCLAWGVKRDFPTWDAYPYTALDGKCKQNFNSSQIAVKANECRYQAVQSNNETAMQAALLNGPISIALDANELQYYASGIIKGKKCSGTDVDHAVLLVGYNADENSYTVKNSWASDWGEKGYFRLAAGVNCLQVASDPATAVPSN